MEKRCVVFAIILATSSALAHCPFVPPAVRLFVPSCSSSIAHQLIERLPLASQLKGLPAITTPNNQSPHRNDFEHNVGVFIENTPDRNVHMAHQDEVTINGNKRRVESSVNRSTAPPKDNKPSEHVPYDPRPNQMLPSNKLPKKSNQVHQKNQQVAPNSAPKHSGSSIVNHPSILDSADRKVNTAHQRENQINGNNRRVANSVNRQTAPPTELNTSDHLPQTHHSLSPNGPKPIRDKTLSGLQQPVSSEKRPSGNDQPASSNVNQPSGPQSVGNPNRFNQNDDYVYKDGPAMPTVLTNTTGFLAMDFALHLFKNLDRPANGNSVISPILLQQLLSNLVDACSPVAERQLQKAIRLRPSLLNRLTASLQNLSASSVNTIEFAAVNFVGKDVTLNQTYLQAAKLRNAVWKKVDFTKPDQAARLANNWVSNATHRLINELINPGSVNPYTQLLLANAIFFKGMWKYSFIQTEPGMFESSPGKSHQVNNMFQLNKLRYGELNFLDGNGLRWVELPYEGDSLAMLIFLPTKRHQLEASLRLLSSHDLAKVMAHLQTSTINTKVNLHLPRFTLTDSVSLIPAFQRLGVTSIFQDKDALRYLSKELTLVSDVTQRSYLSVDELGTKATSVSSLSIVILSITPQYKDVRFDVDQPFLAMIVEKHQRYPIFVAQIYDPQEN